MKIKVKISYFILYFFAIITIISAILMCIKSFYIINNCILVEKTNMLSFIFNPFLDRQIMESTEFLKFNILQDFRSNEEFEFILERVNPLEYNNLIEYYTLDYFFMIGYGMIILILLNNIKNKLIKELGDKTWVHVFNLTLLLIFLIFGVGLDIIENYQLIYQVKKFNTELIETCFYPFRYDLKNFIITINIIYIILFQTIFFIKSKIINSSSQKQT